MIPIIAVAAVLALSPPTLLDEAEHALVAHRVDQARLMLDAAAADGLAGSRLDRLRADIDEASGRDADALVRFERLLAASPADPLLAERAGLAAWRSGNRDKAERFIGRAIASPAASWRAWNAAGVLADDRRDWAAADLAYANAAAAAPLDPMLLNNRGWSAFMRGDWPTARRLLQQAEALDGSNPRIRNNLQLARAALDESLPERAPHENDQAYSARLNDAGMVAALRQDRPRAVSAFARAIDVRGIWYQRAANNLSTIGPAQ